MADLSLELNGDVYIDRLETKLESPKAEVVTPNSEKSLQLVPDDGSSVDGEISKESDDNEMKDECWIDRCERKINTSAEPKCSKSCIKISGQNIADAQHSNFVNNNVSDYKKAKKPGSYEITSASSFFISESKKSKDSHATNLTNLSPIKVQEKEVSMLYQMGVEAVGKPVELKKHEEYPLQQTDQADGQVDGVAMATEESRRDAAKAGWASIRQESGEVENYLLEEDEDENVIIHLGSEFSTDTVEGEKTETNVTIDNMHKSDSVQVYSSDISLQRSPRLAQAEDTTLMEGSCIAKSKLSKLESALSSIGEEGCTRSDGENPAKRPEYQTQVSAENKIDSKDKTFAQEDKTSLADGQSDLTVTKVGLQGTSQTLDQQNIAVKNDTSLVFQGHSTDNKILSAAETEQVHIQPLSQSTLGSYQVRSTTLDIGKNLDTVSSPNQFEVERKFRISQDCRQRLKKMEAKMVKEIQFTDEYFDDIKYKLTLSSGWLRRRNNKWEFKIPLRHAGQGDEVSSECEIAKHLSKLYGLKTSQENMSVEDLLKELHLDIFATFTTNHQMYHLPNCTVQVESTGFGFEVAIIEVVVSDRSRITEALDIIDEVTEKLDIQPFKLL